MSNGARAHCPHCRQALPSETAANPSRCPLCGAYIRGLQHSGESSHSGVMPAVSELQSQFAQRYQSDSLLALHAELCFQKKGILGRGGMGLVQEVVDERLGRRAALKTLQSDSPELRRRFLREARLTARLNHPSIPPIFEMGRTAGGHCYMLMRVIQGRTLKQVIKDFHEQGCPEERLRTLIEVVIKACDALAYAHTQGIIHRDLKPENIMVGDFGDVLVMDWGLAKDVGREEGDIVLDKHAPLAEELDLTQVGAVLGTLGYMPPEQAEGEGVDGRADVFALGGILTCLLTGEPPITGVTNINRLNATLKGHIESPRDRIVCPEDLDFIAAQALEVDLSLRTQSVQELRKQLSEYLEGQLVSDFQYSAWQRFQKSLRRSPERVFAVMALLLVLLVAVTAAIYVQWERERGRIAEAENRWRLKQKEREAQLAEAVILQKEEEKRQTVELMRRFESARILSKQGASPAEIVKAIEFGLELGGRKEFLLKSASDLCESRGLLDEQAGYLREIAKSYPPAYGALMELHTLEHRRRHTGGEPTVYSDRILKLGQQRGDMKDVFVLTCKGIHLKAEGKLDEALSCFNEVELKTRRIFEMYLNRGNLYQKKVQRPLALKDLTRALEIRPRSVHALISRGECLKNMNKDHKSLADLDLAIGIAQKFGPGYFIRGQMYFNMREYDKALRDLLTAHGLNPKQWQALHIALLACYRAAYYKRGVELGTKCLKVKADFHETYFWRGMCHLGMGQGEAAIVDLQRTVQLHPGFVMGFHYLGVCYIQYKNDLNKALQHFNYALEIAPKTVDSLYERASIYWRSKQYAKALADYERVLALKPKHRDRVNIGKKIAQLRRSVGASKN